MRLRLIALNSYVLLEIFDKMELVHLLNEAERIQDFALRDSIL